MNEYSPVLHCVNCGIDFKPTRPLEVGGSGNTWGYPCPICEFQVTPGGETDARLTLPAGDFEPQLTRLLADARARGVPPQELMRVLRDELKFTMELAHPGRRMMLNIIDLGEQEGSGGTLTMRDNRELPNGRSLVK